MPTTISWPPEVPGYIFRPETTASVRLYMPWEPSPGVQEMEAVIRPPNALHRIWIPQTLGEQIWMFYAFATEDEKQSFIKDLPADWLANKWISNADFKQDVIDHYLNGIPTLK